MSKTEEWHVRAQKPDNPVVFMDVNIGGQPAGRIRVELFQDVVPKTTANLLSFFTGSFRSPQTRQPIGYKGCSFHRVIKGFMLQGGDFVKGDGTGCLSIYGARFADENFIARHTGPGIISMANSGPGTNGCQFFITCAKTDWLDQKHVVCGRVLGDGMLVVRKIENVPTNPGNKPKMPVVIAECGEM